MLRDCHLFDWGTIDITPAGPSTPLRVPQHLVNITIPGLAPFFMVSVAEIELPDYYQMVIGMDIMGRGEFRLRPRSGNSLEITFRDPRTPLPWPLAGLFRR